MNKNQLLEVLYEVSSKEYWQQPCLFTVSKDNGWYHTHAECISADTDTEVITAELLSPYLQGINCLGCYEVDVLGIAETQHVFINLIVAALIFQDATLREDELRATVGDTGFEGRILSNAYTLVTLLQQVDPTYLYSEDYAPVRPLVEKVVEHTKSVLFDYASFVQNLPEGSLYKTLIGSSTKEDTLPIIYTHSILRMQFERAFVDKRLTFDELNAYALYFYISEVDMIPYEDVAHNFVWGIGAARVPMRIFKLHQEGYLFYIPSLLTDDLFENKDTRRHAIYSQVPPYVDGYWASKESSTTDANTTT